MEKLVNYIRYCIKPRDNTELYINDIFDESIFASMKQDGLYLCSQFNPENVSNYEYVQIGTYYLVKKCYKNLYWLNDDGTLNFVLHQEPIYRRLIPEPMETVNHTFIISSIIDYLNQGEKKGTFIEYGVRCGKNLNAISKIVDKSYGIDFCKKPEILFDDINYYNGYTDDFSRDELPKIKFNYAFIDADHKFESVIKDFRNIYKYIDINGIIFLHDTYPTMEIMVNDYCFDCYKTPLAIKEEFKNIEILTLPLNPGVTIIRKLG